MRFTGRDGGVQYRVGVVVHSSTTNDGSGEPVLYVESVKEFKTIRKAEAYQRRLAQDEGRVTVLQVGVIQWMTNDDATDAMARLQREGIIWQ
jgi:hypothetical protein